MSLESEFNQYAELVESLESLGDEMVSPADIQHGITAIAGSLELLKKISQLSNDANNLEVREIILSLQEQVIDTKALLIETKGRLVELEEENLELRKKLEAKDELPQLTQKENLWYAEGDGNPKCINCYRNNKKLIDMTRFPAPINQYKCPECKTLA